MKPTSVGLHCPVRGTYFSSLRNHFRTFHLPHGEATSSDLKCVMQLQKTARGQRYRCEKRAKYIPYTLTTLYLLLCNLRENYGSTCLQRLLGTTFNHTLMGHNNIRHLEQINTSIFFVEPVVSCGPRARIAFVIKS